MKNVRRVIRGTAYIPVHDPAHPDIGWGVLRRQLDDTTNSLPAFVQTKLQPMKREIPGEAWERSCWRDDVLLPPSAVDDLYDPRVLCERYEATALPDLKNLALVITIRLRGPKPMHVHWERVRSFAHQRFATERRLAVILVAHVPAHAGSRAANHIHLVVPARELTAQGFGAGIGRLASDRGLPEIAGEWAAWA
ncbi:hypothetical protein [Sphingomonas endolithica]|uniref:hypothetical protein n=1 Tax=Sphingomonas endolithica TaxID=2972485 RepID=UPI0021AE7B9A|nr:hypothetical protein [Sphingomonas sp. ZFBP2030]